jgi:hypothetical protein
MKEKWFNDPACTKIIVEKFSELGRYMKYKPQHKFIGKEFLTIDLVLWEGGRMRVALESENNPLQKPDPIDDEWTKLVYVDADIRILITYCSNRTKRENWLKKASNIISRNPRRSTKSFFLILGDQNYWRFRGYSFDNSGKIVETINLLKK